LLLNISLPHQGQFDVILKQLGKAISGSLDVVVFDLANGTVTTYVFLNHI